MRSRIEVSLRQQAGPGCLAQRTDIYHCLLFEEKKASTDAEGFSVFFKKPETDIFYVDVAITQFIFCAGVSYL